jgi:hypothetical protein
MLARSRRRSRAAPATALLRSDELLAGRGDSIGTDHGAKRPGRWVYALGVAAFLGSVIWAMRLHPMIRACADHSQDGGLTCTYQSLTGPRVAVILMGVVVGGLICGFTYLARREANESNQVPEDRSSQ